MTAQSPSAYASSVVLHVIVVAAILLSAYFLRNRADENPPIFELVGGEGDNYAATKAPAAGEPGASGVDQVAFPPIPVRIPDPEPVAPIPQPQIETIVAPPPVEVVPIQPAVVPKAAPKPDPTAASILNNLKRISDKRAKNIEKKFVAEQKLKAEKERKAAEAEAKRATITKEAFDKANKAAKQTQTKIASSTTKVPSVADGLRNGMAGAPPSSSKSGAGGKATEREEMDLMTAYLALITQRLQRTMEQANFGDELSARIQFSVSSGGLVSGAKILTTSGSGEFDRAIIDALQSMPNLGPPPNGKTGTYTANLKMSDRG